MRCVIQRVSRASVTVGDEPVAAIGQGLLILVGVSLEPLQRSRYPRGPLVDQGKGRDRFTAGPYLVRSLWPQHPQDSGWIHGTRTNLYVVRLPDEATLVSPELVQAYDSFLKGQWLFHNHSRFVVRFPGKPRLC